MTLFLPLPPSPNRTPTGHWAVRHRAKRDYQLECWVAAYDRAIPPSGEDIPRKVEVSAVFYVKRKRDEDNLTASLKWTLDALKWNQPSHAWKRGIGDQRAYFFDDDPDHLTLGSVTQHTDRKAPRVELTIAEIRSLT